HFFWLCVAFFGAFSFSFNGPLDRLDWIFYWGDAIATPLLAPLLLHFMLVFPERPARDTTRLWKAVVPLLYLPAAIIAASRIAAISATATAGAAVSRALEVLDRAQLVYLFVCGVVALVVLVRAFRQLTSLTARRQLRWIAW